MIVPTPTAQRTRTHRFRTHLVNQASFRTPNSFFRHVERGLNFANAKVKRSRNIPTAASTLRVQGIRVATNQTRTVTSERMSKGDLLERFVHTFPKLDSMSESKELSPTAWELRTTEPDDCGWIEWRPIKQVSNVSHLEPLYSKLPARFPPLYEELILSYRWAEVDLGLFAYSLIRPEKI